MYPGTFDPITNGHHELVRRAARIFDEVVVAVAASPHKAPMFALEERMQLARDALADLDNVRVDGYTGLTVGYAKAHGLQVVIRGLRAVSDFEYEFQLASMNRHLETGVETIFMTPAEQYTFVSSTLVREVAALGGDVTALVHPKVAQALGRRFSKR
ncbi:MAG: pantetheine-phosphate adenylyltransferase [Proteobacteria bacterium]|nr:MAG: pantetheine-phosphate adenylyltransferase [Pseudomonadota bacterium]MBC6945424.1 pantetheine-phosphate adenylyltransferase [Gammaproteobacteria bacterium]MCE7895719.1 pantetheine-phosphate adenylyltransferase [Gammaproteobacteria bacterium PRO8]MDL1881111.1 pantetheine-phosphate adenylyltransferase [Gammaproteobacteria bacterium PRO2]MCL4776808.1 pantetheine-phosphate adenylyltransferase [Gammaproteobacteria bacterium]